MKYLMFIIILVFSGCVAPEKIVYKVNLYPLSGDPTWSNGNQKLQFTGKRGACSVCFMGKKDEYFEFELSVKNISQSPFVFDPLDFYYETSVRKNDTSMEIVPLLIYSVNADTVATALQRKKAELQSAKNPYAESGFVLGAKILVSTIDVISLFSGFTKSNEVRTREQKERDERNEQEENRRRSEEDWEKSHSDALNDVTRKLDYWSGNVVRKNTLAPRQIANGRVCFPIVNKADTLSLTIMVCEDTMVVHYKQQVLFL